MGGGGGASSSSSAEEKAAMAALRTYLLTWYLMEKEKSASRSTYLVVIPSFSLLDAALVVVLTFQAPSLGRRIVVV